MTSNENKKALVMLVDDDSFLLSMYRSKFEREGYSAESFMSVHDALARFRSGVNPDAIVFDLIMPQDDGFAFLEALRKENLASDAAKIALTNQNSEGEQKRVLELGADSFLVKASLIPSEVVNTVQDILERKRKA